ncbi:luciferin sulfotransferase-like [Neocloeon triangulifer]|uniref:luciferin sulfotransferase-like n=1 Tax=Neocloeon triangulifer TaxID=2078957 RepID=UPI00286F5139|nr:luciferin sulfotransferase-like [Neocloeon triangulifer]
MQVKYRDLEADLAKKLEAMFGVANGGMIEVNPGQVLIPPKFKDVAQRIVDMEVHPDDVWLVSYPRTGSTWTQEMVWLLGNDLDFQGAKMLQQLRAPVLELTALLGNDTSGVIKLIGETVDIVESMPSPRFIKTHLPLELLPKQLDTVKPKIVYVCRNPKDMCVSYYHYCRLMHDLHGSFEDFCELFLQEKVPMGPIWNHIMGFWKRRNDPNVLFLKYEELKKDLRSCVLRCAKFLDKTLTEKEVEAVLDHLSFESMKNNPAVNLEPVLEYRKTALMNQMAEDQITCLQAPSFIRKGVNGDWANHMSPEMAARFDEWNEKHLEGTGLSFSA